MDKRLIAHELGHAMMGYLYEPKQTPGTMSFESDLTISAYVLFNHTRKRKTAKNSSDIARIRGNSYLGGIFGELIECDKTYIIGTRGDIDDMLTGLRFLGKNNSSKVSKSKIFKELWTWFYTDKDAWSFTGMMARWMDENNLSNMAGSYMHSSRVKSRLPETWRIYQKFLKHINIEEFKAVVDEIHDKNKIVIRKNILEKYGKRIIKREALEPRFVRC